MTTLTITTPSGDQFTLPAFGDREQALEHARRTTTGPWEVREDSRVVATGYAKVTYTLA